MILHGEALVRRTRGGGDQEDEGETRTGERASVTLRPLTVTLAAPPLAPPLYRNNKRAMLILVAGWKLEDTRAHACRGSGRALTDSLLPVQQV